MNNKENMEKREFSEMLSKMKVLTHEVVSFAKNSEIEVEAFSEFGMLVEKFPPILNELSDNSTVLDKPSIRKSLESLENELRRAKTLTKSSNLRHPIKQIEDMTHDIGRSLGVLLVASLEVSIDFREKIGTLQKQMMNARFDGSSSITSSPKSELFANETRTVWEIEEEIVNVPIDDVILQLKNGSDDEFAVSLLRLKEFMRSEKLDGGLINEEGIIAILFKRLVSCKADNRLSIIQLLRSIAFENDEKKVKIEVSHNSIG
jgi:vacuolar protein 8